MQRAAVLKALIAALQEDIAPELSSSKASATLLSVRNILAFLAADAGSRADRDNPALSIPAGFYGDIAEYRQREERVRSMIADGSFDRDDLREALAWEAGAAAGLVEAADGAWSPRSAAPTAIAQGDRSLPGATEIEAYLRSRYPDETALRVATVQSFAGGRSKFTALVRLAGCSALPDRLVIRMDLAVSTTGSPSVKHEFALMRALHAQGLMVPEPLLLETRADALGGAFFLMRHAEGTAASGLLRPPYSRHVAAQLAVELAKLHRVAIAGMADAIHPITPPTRAAMLAELNGFAARWRDHEPEPSLAMHVALAWLRDHIDLAVEGPAAVTHRDPLFHNVLAVGDRMTALLDWEFVRISYPAEDLGWVRSVITPIMPWPAFVAAYREAGGHALSDAALDFYSIWGAVRLLSMMTYSNWLIAHGHIGSIEYVCVALHETHIVRNWLSTLVAQIIVPARQLEKDL